MRALVLKYTEKAGHTTASPEPVFTQDTHAVRPEYIRAPVNKNTPTCLVRTSYQYGEEEDEGLQARRTRFMDAGLVAVGIRRLNELLEDDIDTRKKKENVGGVVETVEVPISCFRTTCKALGKV